MPCRVHGATKYVGTEHKFSFFRNRSRIYNTLPPPLSVVCSQNNAIALQNFFTGCQMAAAHYSDFPPDPSASIQALITFRSFLDTQLITLGK
jgi:hypothetical protein